MSAPPVDQLRSLCGDEPESVYSWPLIYWQKKQVDPTPQVNPYDLMWVLYRQIESQSSTLQDIKEAELKRRRANRSGAMASLAIEIAKQTAQAEREALIEEFRGGWG